MLARIPTRSHGASSIGICILLLVLVSWTFLPSLSNDYIDYDDGHFIFRNAYVQSGLNWADAKWAFANLEGGFWHPLTWLSLMADAQVYGARPWGYHLTNLLLHTINVVLLFLMFRRLTGTVWRSAAVALLFGIHPLHVESVAWIFERKDVLSTFFWTLTVLMYVNYVQQSKNRRSKSTLSYALALVFFVCGLMSKTMVVTLPLLLLLLDWWPLGRLSAPLLSSRLWLLLEKAPFFAAAFVTGLLTIYAEGHVGALSAGRPHSLWERVCTALSSYVIYLRQTFWPLDLAAHYPYPTAFPLWGAVGAGLALLLISAAVVWNSRKRPYLAVGWAWYVVTLLPVIGLIQLSTYSRADRFTYVPLIGLFVLLAWGGYDLLRGWRYAVQTLSVAAAGIALLCIGQTRQQIGYWKNDEILWRHAAEVTADNDLAHYNLGVTLALRGEFDEAIPHYREAVRISPEQHDAHNSLAYVLLKTGRFPEAIREYEEALRLMPISPEGHNNLANLLIGQERLKEAIEHCREALRLNPSYPEAHYNLGLALAADRRYPEAAAELQEVLRLNPGYADARQKLEQLLATQPGFEEALAQGRQAVHSNPEDAQGHSNLASLLLGAGQLDEAINEYSEAARLAPNNAEAQYQLGMAFTRKGELDKAARQFGLALELKPKFAAAHYALGTVHQLQRRTAEALDNWRAAVRLAPLWPDPLNNIAWVLATDPDPKLRNGPEAVRLASRAVEVAGTKNVSLLDTLAASYAEAGRFAEASATLRAALAAAEAKGQKELASRIQQRLALYDCRQPYREAPARK